MHWASDILGSWLLSGAMTSAVEVAVAVATGVDGHRRVGRCRAAVATGRRCRW